MERRGGDRTRGVAKPTERGVVIHRCHEGEGAGRTNEVVAVRQQTEVFARIAVGEGEGHGEGRQFLSVVLLVECRVVAADEYMYEVRRLRVDGG